MMDSLRRFLHRLRALFSKRPLDQEFDTEIASHLELAIEENIQTGLSPEEARRQAMLRFGGIEQAKEQHRETRGLPLLEMLGQDIRHALRMLRKSPGFTSVAVATLALGIGANGAVFGVVNAALLRPLPYRQESRLVMVWEQNFQQGQDHNVVSPANFLNWQDQTTVFDQMAGFYDGRESLTGEGDPEQVPVQVVTTNMFSLLGVSPLLGRDFSADEGLPGHDQVVMLSYGLWQRKFGGEKDIVGKTIRLSGETYAVVGVMPARVQLLVPRGSLTGQAPQLWLTIAWTQKSRVPRGRFMTAIARLKDGVTLDDAQQQISAVEDLFRKQYPEFESGWGVHLVPLRNDLVGNVRPALLVLLGAVAFVLLIACANVANLLLARASGRSREIAVRRALGASRWRIAQQSLTESLVLAICGGGLGVLVAIWTTSLLLALAPKNLLPVEHIGVDLRIVLFLVAVSLLTAIVCGLAPALDAARADLSASMRESGRGMTGARGSRLRHFFAVAEIALSLVLLAGAGLLSRSFVRLTDVDPGFQPHNLLAMRIELSGAKYKEDAAAVAFFRQLLDRVRALSGVRAASMANAPPLQGPGPATDFTIVGRPAPALGQENVTDVRVVDPDYFQTLGIPLLRGRTFTPREETVMSHVVVISQSLARAYFPDQDPIGRKLAIDMKLNNDPSEIVGVVGDVKHYGLDTAPPAVVYWPHAELVYSGMTLVIRADSNPVTQVGSIRAILHGMDPELPIARVATMDEWVSDSVAKQRFSATLLSIFAAIALILATVGIYGVVAYAVSQRTREFGIRLALGAGRGKVLILVLRYGARLALLGVIFGAAGTFTLSQSLRSLLFHVSPFDPLTLASVAVFLSGVTLLACWIPARRATKVDPLIALRYE